MKLVFDMSSFDLKRTKEELFADDYRMKNTTQLSNSIDSLSYNQSKQKYIMLKNSNAFYDFHMKDNFIFPEGVKKIRSELNEDNLIKDFYSKNEKFIDLDQSFYSENIIQNYSRNTYSRALNSARNIKTNLSINSARIKSQNFEINKNEIELLKKYAQAFACLSMFIIGAPLGSLIKRGGIGFPVIISIGFYIVYYVLNILGIKWAREDIISPALAAWLSNLVLLPIGLFFLHHSRKDSRIFDTNLIELIKSKIHQIKKTR
tara:strand:- start:319 stop:1101 length:783 start_codon:yes stop_codon:yes gene_type:complete